MNKAQLIRQIVISLRESLAVLEKAARASHAEATHDFQVGHTMEIVGLDGEDEMMGIIVEAKEKGQIGHLPLADLEVKPKTDKNYWSVREYVMWFGNR